MSTENKATIKKRISPVKITLEVIVNRINANGTLSGVEIVSATNDTKLAKVFAVSHNASGGAIWLKMDSLKGVEVISDAGVNARPKDAIKLF